MDHKDNQLQQRLFQFRYHFIIAIVASSIIIAFVSYGVPSLLTILTYFWPLLASTTLFLVAIVAFGGLSQLATEAHGEKAGQGLLEYVAAARPEVDPHNFDQ